MEKNGKNVEKCVSNKGLSDDNDTWDKVAGGCKSLMQQRYSNSHIKLTDHSKLLESTVMNTDEVMGVNSNHISLDTILPANKNDHRSFIHSFIHHRSLDSSSPVTLLIKQGGNPGR